MTLAKPAIGIHRTVVGLGWGLSARHERFGQPVFADQALGSLVRLHGGIVGAAHVGQNFWALSDDFWGRPSVTVSVTTGKPDPYNRWRSEPSNLGPTNRQLLQHVQERADALLTATPRLRVQAIPLNLVESSGSGLNPGITVAGAEVRIPRVARAAGFSTAYPKALVALATRPSHWGMFGCRRVNVPALNLLLYRSLHPLGKGLRD